MQSISQPAQPFPHESMPRLLREWRIDPAPQLPAAARLGAWLGWAESIEFAQALTAPPGRGASEAARIEALQWAGAELAQLQAQLASGFTFPGEAPGSDPLPEGAAFTELLAPRLQHVAHQQRAIANRMGPLRARLRTRLVGVSGELARLAQLDEYIERALASPGRRAAAGLSALLEMRARRHHAVDPLRWRPRLDADLQRLLRAELDQGLQPVLGLVEALGTSTSR